MRKTSSAHAKEQLSLIDLPPAPARGEARRRVDGSRRALQAATNARRCEELLAALDRSASNDRVAAAVAPPARPAVSAATRGERGPYATAPTAGDEEMAQRLADLYAACERASDQASAIPRRAAR